MTALFMGFFCSPLFEKSIDAPLFSHFTSGGQYLSKITFEGKSYLAKPLPPVPKIEALQDAQKHILSIASRIAPQYPLSREDIVIFPIFD